MTATEALSPPVPVPEPGRPYPESAGEAPRRWKWTGDDLIRMGEVGLLPPEGRFELLDGEIYRLMPPGPLHAFIVTVIGELLAGLARSRGAHVREEKPILLNAEYEPQPDVAVVRGPKGRYRARFPAPEDLILVVEVSDSTLDHDRNLKLPAYAAAGVAECWLVNLPEQRVEVYRDPSPTGYRTRRLYLSGETVEPLALSGATIAASDLLGETAEPDAPASGEQPRVETE